MMAIRTLDLFLFSFLSLAVQCHHALLQNVSLQWKNGFEPQLTWVPLKNCTYDVSKDDECLYENRTPPWEDTIVMEGGIMQLKVKAVCTHNNKTTSEEVIRNVNYPDLVRRDFRCYVYSASRSHCSWLPASHASDVRFFYWLNNEDFTVPANQNSSSSLQECPSYTSTDGIRTGCDLEANIIHSIHILFNGTVNNTFSRNTFKKHFKYDIQPLPFNWTVTKAGEKFNISVTPPDFPCDWEYKVTHTDCKHSVETPRTKDTTFVFEPRWVPRCPHDMSITANCEDPKATVQGRDKKHFDADTSPDAWLLAAVFIPLILGCLAALLFVCYRTQKEHIFPKVPVPRDLISDIYDHNKSTLLRMYVPSVEEENVKITLVIDPLVNKLN